MRRHTLLIVLFVVFGLLAGAAPAAGDQPTNRDDLRLCAEAEGMRPGAFIRLLAEIWDGMDADFNVGRIDIVAGTEQIDTFLNDPDNIEVFCGLGGGDQMLSLGVDDVFFGGAGAEDVYINYGTVYGGAGDEDSVIFNYGTFYGGTGWAIVQYNYGTFYGGAGDDYVVSNYGTFDGEAGDDHVEDNYGTVYGGAGDDHVGYNYGTFYGGAGDDHVWFNYGTCVNVETCGLP